MGEKEREREKEKEKEKEIGRETRQAKPVMHNSIRLKILGYFDIVNLH